MDADLLAAFQALARRFGKRHLRYWISLRAQLHALASARQNPG